MEKTNENSQDENTSEIVGQTESESENPCDLSNKISSDRKEEVEENFEKVRIVNQLSSEMFTENKKLTDKHEKEEIAKDEIVDVDVKVEILEEDPSGTGDLFNSIGKELAAGIKKGFYNGNLEMLNFKCPECLKIFKKERYLKMHIKEVHMEAQMSICHICSKEFKSFHLKRHIKNVHIKEECSCDKCGKVYTNRKHLRDHKKTVHEGLDLLCHLCCKSFKSKSYLSNHIRRFHNAVDEELICDYCSKLFQTQNKLYLHIKAVHTIENLPCHECGKIYKNSYLLRKHIKHNHPSAQTSELTHSSFVMQNTIIQKSGVIPNSGAILSTEGAHNRNVVQNDEAVQSRNVMLKNDATMQNSETGQSRNVMLNNDATMQNSETGQSRNVIQHVIQHSDPAMMDMEMAQERDVIQNEPHNSVVRINSDSISYAGMQKDIGLLSPHPLSDKTS